MHFTRMSDFATKPVPTIERGEGAYIWDTNGRRYLDGLSGLFVVQAGHGRVELAEAAAAQARKLAYFPIWSYAHPTAIELADRLAAEAPGDLNKVFFSCGGGESVETAWKVTKQYRKMPAGTWAWDYGCAENNRNPISGSGKTLTLGPNGKPIDKKVD